MPKSKKQNQSEAVSKFTFLSKECIRYCDKVGTLISENENIAFLTGIKTKLDNLAGGLESAFLLIEDNEEFYDKYIQTSDQVLEALAKIEIFVSQNSGSADQKVRNDPEAKTLKLPKMTLMNFYGDTEDWISFREIFKSAILDNSQLTDLEKLQYLQTAVRGSAAKLIRGFSLQGENLKNCWDILCQRFENKRILALAQINNLFLSKITKVDNSKGLLELLDRCNEAVRNLKTLGLESNALSDLMIIRFMLSKLDELVRQRWELTLDNHSIPSLESFKSFMEKEARSLENKRESRNDSSISNRKPMDNRENKMGNSNRFRKPVVNSTIVEKGNICVVCKQNHKLFKCPKFNNMPLEDRWGVVQTHKLCENCLRDNHSQSECKLSYTCKCCALRHHTLLHRYTVAPEPVHSVSAVSNNAGQNSMCVLLSTALVNVKGSSGEVIQCKLLIDNASQNSLITRKCAERLQLNFQNTSHQLIGINGLMAETSLHSTTFEFSAHFSKKFLKINAFVVNQITSPLPNFRLRKHSWPHLEGIQLADPTFYDTSEIDILLGAELATRLIIGPPLRGQHGTPDALPTEIGYVLAGKVGHCHSDRKSVSHLTVSLNETLQKFWTVESVPIQEIQTEDDELAETLFKKSVKRDENGRYIVKLPIKVNSNLGESKTQAHQRFHLLEKKLDRNPALKEQYVTFMKEYEKLNHMSVVKSEDVHKIPHYYLPHHGVVNENSTTTKLRVVFDASARTSNQHSLNDILLTGPKLQTHIFCNLITFRSYPVAFVADIAKMYRQIRIAEEDQDYQRIVWRNNQDEPLKIFRLNTVTYGTSAAPFLALRTLHQLCDDEKENFPIASELSRTHFYVDDLLCGAASVGEARSIIPEMIKFMESGGFPLRKWSCNYPEVIENLPDHMRASTDTHSFQNDVNQKVLGLEWNGTKDSLRVRAVLTEHVNSKRQLLSVIAKTYDPLGLIAPATIKLKIMLQEIWKTKIGWDDSLPHYLLEEWQIFQSQSFVLQDISAPRYLQCAKATTIELHGFSDASTKAYAAVVYIRAISETVRVSFVAAKTRVAPVQTLTLPRLELCGALLLAELVNTIKKTLSLSNEKTFLWCDSTITLSWIANPPSSGNQFVRHRVTKILSMSNVKSWNFIPSRENPADCASRGLFPNQLKDHKTWLTGPTWLQNASNWASPSTIPDVVRNDSHIEEDLFLATTASEEQSLLKRYSSYKKTIRVIGWILRYFYNLKHKERLSGTLTVPELDRSLKCILLQIQQETFNTEINCLRKKRAIPTSSRLLRLNVFLDAEGLLRVGGRLSKHPTLPYDHKYPIILPKQHHFTKLVVEHFHEVSLHGGTEMVLSLIRQQFWIIDGRSTVKEFLRMCIRCFRYSARPPTQLMGDLPASRITPSRAFENTGVDFAGPIITKCQHIRKASEFKSYICLFVCFSTKAVHLELVSSLSAQAFLAAFRRFVARRGLPTHMHSDNGKNFVGAASYLKELVRMVKDPIVQDYCASRNVTWHFIPPYAPNFGGLWESSIKLAKRHLVKITRGALLNFEELSTLLCQIEACLNSRPLTSLSTNVNDFQALTPGHFLIGSPLLEIPESDSANNHLSFYSRWRLLLQLKEQFWRRWSKDYLQSLQPRTRWTRAGRQLQLGQMVLVEDKASPQGFILGRIARIFPGKDDITRVVSIRTATGEVTRAVGRIRLLPISDCAPPEDVSDKTLIEGAEVN
ncbi:uncharacterized protein LOC129222899 [Uloborus diversus]|uniref:uncharacterized protein LOC129222899 n=1 Tax=Uloborus diversus TaxID=327109 RepID=UPI0024097666|nr:uncharacterized protein LOC129222899 [Uloborus diversus]